MSQDTRGLQGESDFADKVRIKLFQKLDGSFY